MGDRLAEYWVREFEQAHGFKPRFEKRDGVILHDLLKHYGDRWAMAWAIHAYHQTKDDDFLQKNGWSTPAFRARCEGLLARYHDRRQKDRSGKFRAELRRLSESPQLAPIIDLAQRRMQRGA